MFGSGNVEMFYLAYPDSGQKVLKQYNPQSEEMENLYFCSLNLINNINKEWLGTGNRGGILWDMRQYKLHMKSMRSRQTFQEVGKWNHKHLLLH